MPNGPGSYSHVTRIDQRDDDTVVVHVQTDSFKPGREVELSGYLTQGFHYAAFNRMKYIPFDAKPGEAVELPVELPAMRLEPGKDVTVVVRVAEAWPTLLGQNTEIPAEYKGGGGTGLKAAWTPKSPPGKWTGGPASPPPGGGVTPNPQP